MRWYGENRRDLPWREDNDAYHIWISEIMLQQTRVEAVKGYYARFRAELPDIGALAGVSEERLLKLWEGLGYYNRAKNLKRAAGVVLEQYGGQMPESYEELLKLPGIGAYTAGAIASIAFGEAVAAVDGNVLRVIARYLADPEDIGNEALKVRRKEELERVIPVKTPGAFNQALMDLGATVCLPNGAPKCGICPLRRSCLAKKEGRTQELPYKASKAKRRVEERTVFVIRYQDRILLHKRPEKGLLAGMYELPACDGHLSRKAALEHVKTLGFVPVKIEPLPESRHIFSHLEWKMRAYLVRADELFAKQDGRKCHAENAGKTETEYRLETPERIGREIPIPSAFAAYAGYLGRLPEGRL